MSGGWGGHSLGSSRGSLLPSDWSRARLLFDLRSSWRDGEPGLHGSGPSWPRGDLSEVASRLLLKGRDVVVACKAEITRDCLIQNRR